MTCAARAVFDAFLQRVELRGRQLGGRRVAHSHEQRVRRPCVREEQRLGHRHRLDRVDGVEQRLQVRAPGGTLLARLAVLDRRWLVGSDRDVGQLGLGLGLEFGLGLHDR